MSEFTYLESCIFAAFSEKMRKYANGDVPFIITSSVDAQASYPRYDKNAIIEFALGEVDAILPNLISQDDKLRVSHDAGLMLKAEEALTGRHLHHQMEEALTGDFRFQLGIILLIVH